MAESTIRKYRIRGNKPPSQTWRSFLKNHLKDIAAIDFFTVHTIDFRVLYCFIVLQHDRRNIIYFNVTTHPTASRTSQQIIEAFPFDETPKYLIRDRDGMYGNRFRYRLKQMGIEEVLIAPRSPWQNPFVERVIGSIRRDCFDHVIVLNEAHSVRILSEYIDYYHNARPHQSLDHNTPLPRTVESPDYGRVVSDPILGGLHHRYRRAAWMRKSICDCACLFRWRSLAISLGLTLFATPSLLAGMLFNYNSRHCNPAVQCLPAHRHVGWSFRHGQ